jgi:GAF domain-containing protein
MTSLNELKIELKNIISDKESSPHKILKNFTQYLQKDSEKYSWVGFYHMNDTNQTLHLGQYTGKETDHTVIPYGRGICGQVAVSGHTYIAKDVTAESNYIACSLDVRSEIVVPIYYKNELVAQLDIDSSQVNAFNEDDRKMLEEVCAFIGTVLGHAMKFEKVENQTL